MPGDCKKVCGARSECKNPPSDELHCCPYAQEINDDDEFECDCCTECTEECAMDI